jgi:RNA polymerase sigma-70 factor (ECF subfamily)
MPGDALGRCSADSQSERLQAARDGSLEAIGRLYEMYGPALYSLAYRITGSRVDAEDVLQDVFVALPRALRSYREQGQFSAWLKRIATCTALRPPGSSTVRFKPPGVLALCVHGLVE